MKKNFKFELDFFSKILRLKRFELNITQEKLAEIVGLHPNAIGRLERAESVPNYITIIKIARRLKCSPKDFMPD